MNGEKILTSVRKSVPQGQVSQALGPAIWASGTASYASDLASQVQKAKLDRCTDGRTDGGRQFFSLYPMKVVARLP